MGSRAWREHDHPRWPKGSGDKGGEFRGGGGRGGLIQTDRGGLITREEAARVMFGDDWAAKTSSRAQPAGRYGSIATGKTSQCPTCGKTVKLVGTTDKQSTHNKARGQRCEGSGLTVGPEGLSGGDVQVRRSKPPTRKNPEIKVPPPPPGIVIGPPKELVGGRAGDRMDRWRADAKQPGVAFDVKTRREQEIAQAEHRVKYWRKITAQQKKAAIAGIRREMIDQGYDPDYPPSREEWGYSDEIKRRTRSTQETLDRATAELASLRSGGPGENFTVAELDAPLLDYKGATQITGGLAQKLDPARPLAVYGDMLHIDDSSWHVYQALDSLEQRVPPIYHEIAAEWMAKRKNSGIWISSHKPLPDLDDLGDLRGEKPRGWHKGATWNDVDGVVSGGATMAVSYTQNTESHRQHRTPSLKSADITRNVDASATLHEFGHVLDSALGMGDQAKIKNHIGGRASERRLWRLVHGKVIKAGGRFQNPYFRQKGDAGPQELWADAFGAWAESDPSPKNDAFGDPMVWHQGGSKTRAVTHRVAHLASMYDVSYDEGFELNDYFDRLLADVEKGRKRR